MCSAPEPVFGGTEGTGSCFHVCSTGFIFGGIEGAKSRVHVLHSWNHFGCSEDVAYKFHVLRSRTHFRQYGGCRVQFACFVPTYLFSTVPRALGLVFMFSTPKLVFGGTEVAESTFHALRSEIHFRRYRGREVWFSCFTLPDPFSAVKLASGPVFIFCAPGPVLGGINGVGSNFHVLRSRTRFGQYRECRDTFSRFSPELIFGVVTSFHVLRSRTYFGR
jgi:hypothetical protein